MDDEHSFKWWVHCTLILRETIIADVNNRTSRVTHKHGVKLPTSVAYDKRLDDVNSNTL